MGELVSQRKRVKHAVEIGTVEVGAGELVTELDARIEAIQPLIPLGLEAVREELQRAVVELAGSRYQRKEIDQHHGRWGSQPGSVYLADQKVPVAVPRVRNVGQRHGSSAGRLPRSSDASEWTRVYFCGC